MHSWMQDENSFSDPRVDFEKRFKGIMNAIYLMTDNLVD